MHLSNFTDVTYFLVKALNNLQIYTFILGNSVVSESLKVVLMESHPLPPTPRPTIRRYSLPGFPISDSHLLNFVVLTTFNNSDGSVRNFINFLNCEHISVGRSSHGPRTPYRRTTPATRYSLPPKSRTHFKDGPNYVSSIFGSWKLN